MSETQRDRLVVALPADEQMSAETLWIIADRTGDNFFKLDNVPLFAFGLALDDVVRAERRDDGRWHFVELVKPSGLLTVRVAGLHAEEDRFAGVVRLLKSNSVASERYGERYVAYAMHSAAFAEIETAVDEIIGDDDEELFVEIGND